MLNSDDHQILYGRRGTGKTHALLHLSHLVENVGDVAVYADMRTIGTAGGLYADGTVSAVERGTQLLVDTLETVHEELLEVAIDSEVADQEGLLRALDALAEAATEVAVVGDIEQETTVGGTAESSSSVDITASADPSARVSAGGRRSITAQGRLRRTGVERHHVLFGPLSRALRGVIDALRPARLWFLLDEWSSVPVDLQPLLADLLRRSVLPVAGITVKIATIEHRTRFILPDPVVTISGSRWDPTRPPRSASMTT